MNIIRTDNKYKEIIYHLYELNKFPDIRIDTYRESDFIRVRGELILSDGEMMVEEQRIPTYIDTDGETLLNTIKEKILMKISLRYITRAYKERTKRNITTANNYIYSIKNILEELLEVKDV